MHRTKDEAPYYAVSVAFCCFSSSYNDNILSAQFSDTIIGNYTYHLLKHKQNLHFLRNIIVYQVFLFIQMMHNWIALKECQNLH